MATFLESILRQATLATPHGGCCRIGDAVITVRYCSDLWEWDYNGETFWDIEDLAEALIRGNAMAPREALAVSQRAKPRRDLHRDEAAREGSLGGVPVGLRGGR